MNELRHLFFLQMAKAHTNQVAAHDASLPASRSLCDELFEALSQRIPDMERSSVRHWCCFSRAGRKRFAYIKHRKSGLVVWFRGDSTHPSKYPGLEIRERTRTAPGGFVKNFKARFDLDDLQQIQVACDLLVDHAPAVLGEFVTSRDSLPAIEEEMAEEPRCNMWRYQRWPYKELKEGDTVFWFDGTEQAIVWRSRVRAIERFKYGRKEEVWQRFQQEQFRDAIGVFDPADPYFQDKPERGYCLAFRVDSMSRLWIPKPADYWFPRLGWLRCSDEDARDWLTKLRSLDRPDRPEEADFNLIADKLKTEGGSASEERVAGGVTVAADDEVVEALEKSHAKSQGFLLDSKLRKALEDHAMAEAKRYFKSKRYEVEDHHKDHPYDLCCTKKNETLHVEVKGTQTHGDSIILTSREVEFARRHKGQMALFLVCSIKVSEAGKIMNNGEKTVILPWDVDAGCLKPISFLYGVPGNRELAG